MTDETAETVSDDSPNHFHEDEYVHGVAQGLKEKYDLSDDVYSHIVYGIETPVTEDGEIAESTEEAIAVLAIIPPIMPGGVPMAFEVPLLEDAKPFTVETEAEDLETMDIVVYYDDEQESTITGLVVDIDEDEDMATLAVGDEDENQQVVVHTGGDMEQVEINGESLAGGYQMGNDDEEQEKDWWRIEEIEAEIREQVE